MDGPGEEVDSHATLSVPELQTLEAGGLITLGGHTHHCVKLSSLSEPEQRNEIEYNKQILEEALGHRIECFAYPFGEENSYTTETCEDPGGLADSVCPAAFLLTPSA